MPIVRRWDKRLNDNIGWVHSLGPKQIPERTMLPLTELGILQIGQTWAHFYFLGRKNWALLENILVPISLKLWYRLSIF